MAVASDSKRGKRPALAASFDLEAALIAQGCPCVAGVDEAGRGPLAGPVAAAAVVLDPNDIPDGIADSKALSPSAREEVFEQIMARAVVSVAFASAARIDATDIRKASLWAMARAVAGLARRPAHALIDGRDVPPGLCCPARAVIGGDASSLSIAAASIVAKVARDRLMRRLGAAFPGYGFEEHFGYSTPGHRAALLKLGPSVHHRRSFAPVAELLGLTSREEPLLLPLP